jgi:hypothetical protein
VLRESRDDLWSRVWNIARGLEAILLLREAKGDQYVLERFDIEDVQERVAPLGGIGISDDNDYTILQSIDLEYVEKQLEPILQFLEFQSQLEPLLQSQETQLQQLESAESDSDIIQDQSHPLEPSEPLLLSDDSSDDASSSLTSETSWEEIALRKKHDLPSPDRMSRSSSSEMSFIDQDEEMDLQRHRPGLYFRKRSR